MWLFQYPIRRTILTSREVSKPRDLHFDYQGPLKFDGIPAAVPLKFHKDTIIQLNTRGFDNLRNHMKIRLIRFENGPMLFALLNYP